VDELIDLAATASMPQVRALASLKLRQRGADLERALAEQAENGAPARSEAELASAMALASDVARFLSRPVTAAEPRLPAPEAPPGAPIGEPAMDWFTRLSAPCTWDDGQW
jgi:hypothetical protein